MTQQYVGTKIVTAWPAEKDGRPGYGVKYADGYTSWSPKEIFEAAYLPLGHIEHLPDFLQRVIAEAADLHARLTRLNAFLESEQYQRVSERDRDDLQAQARAMTAYWNALSTRVDHLRAEAEASFGTGRD